MDPLSAIASTIAITQALGFGIKKLQSLANSNAEFCDLLNELSSLQGWLGQLDALDLANVKTFPASAAARLHDIKTRLEVVVNDLDEIVKRLHGEKNSVATGNGKRVKVSKLSWQRNRSTVLELRDRARQCREDLVACLELLGLSQQ